MAEQQLPGRFSRSGLRRILVSLLWMSLGVVVGIVGSRYDWEFFAPSYYLKTDLATAAGLKPKAQVNVNGLPVGQIRSIGWGPGGGKQVEVTMKIAKKYQSAIRADSRAFVTTAGLLGESYIQITRGSPDQPTLESGDVVRAGEMPESGNCKGLADALSKLIDASKTGDQH